MINYFQFKEVLNKYNKFDKNVLNALYSEFGRDVITDYFNQYYSELSEEELSEFVKKYSAFFEQSDDYFFEAIDYKNVSDVVGMIINNAAMYQLLTLEEEKEIGNIVKKGKNELVIIEDDDDKLYPVLKMEEIFLSIKKAEQIGVLKKIKKLPIVLEDDSVLKREVELIRRYLKLSNGRVLKQEELVSKFPELDFNNRSSLTKKCFENQMNLLYDYVIAKSKLYSRNLRLVISRANARKLRKDLSFEDLIQFGNLGLITAVNKYDVDKGFKFSTYATWWIRQAINRGIIECGDAIRKPVHLNDKLYKYSKFVREYQTALGVNPSITEIANHMGITEQMVKDLELNYLDLISLETPVGEEDDTLLLEFVKSDEKGVSDQVIDAVYFEDIMNTLKKNMKPKELEVLLYRYGINSEQRVYTLKELGEMKGITRERVRQLEVKSLRRAQFLLRKKGNPGIN